MWKKWSGPNWNLILLPADCICTNKVYLYIKVSKLDIFCVPICCILPKWWWHKLLLNFQDLHFLRFIRGWINKRFQHTPSTYSTGYHIDDFMHRPRWDRSGGSLFSCNLSFLGQVRVMNTLKWLCKKVIETQNINYE